ncbi:nuclease-related domain-containing protein [Paenisporosarcina sp. TG-14]|uniref:nuclease-related domain-containing protein n=1 Tax=Paenisporosarcina sp. TG-14 TaxID=1231057 RepID=UPI00030DE976|nr:nuclease-related domain-containing protein [Paenisporosarcina sp. TG-14]
MIFIQIKKEISTKLVALKRLHRRMSINHPKYIDVKRDLYNAKAGHGGEEYIDSVLSSIYFPIPHIFHNIRFLEKNIPSTQTDILVFTSAYALIIEVNNWSGKTTFQDIGQILQKNEHVESIDCPTIHADYFRDNLQDWFSKHDLHLPVHRVVIFPYASTINYCSENGDIHFAKELLAIVQKLNKLPIQLSEARFITYSKKISHANHPYASHSICQQYKIMPSDLLKGIFCTKCDGPLVKESNRIYVCAHCLHIPDNPFYDVMVDWFTLIGNQISNRQLRFLSGIDTSYIVGYFMKKSQFPHSGMNKGTIYHVNQQEQQNFILQGKKQHHNKQKS